MEQNINKTMTVRDSWNGLNYTVGFEIVLRGRSMNILIVTLVVIGIFVMLLVLCYKLYRLKYRNFRTQVPNSHDSSREIPDTTRASILPQVDSAEDVLRPITHTMNTRHTEGTDTGFRLRDYSNEPRSGGSPGGSFGSNTLPPPEYNDAMCTTQGSDQPIVAQLDTTGNNDVLTPNSTIPPLNIRHQHGNGPPPSYEHMHTPGHLPSSEAPPPSYERAMMSDVASGH